MKNILYYVMFYVEDDYDYGYDIFFENDYNDIDNAYIDYNQYKEFMGVSKGEGKKNYKKTIGSYSEGVFKFPVSIDIETYGKFQIRKQKIKNLLEE